MLISSAVVARTPLENFFTQFPLPMHRETFEQIVDAFNLPHSFLDVLNRDTTTFVKMQLDNRSGTSDLEGERTGRAGF